MTDPQSPGTRPPSRRHRPSPRRNGRDDEEAQHQRADPHRDPRHRGRHLLRELLRPRDLPHEHESSMRPSLLLSAQIYESDGENAYCGIDGTQFKVRGPNYLKDKVKIVSKPCIGSPRPPTPRHHPSPRLRHEHAHREARPLVLQTRVPPRQGQGQGPQGLLLRVQHCRMCCRRAPPRRSPTRRSTSPSASTTPSPPTWRAPTPLPTE